MSLRGQATEVPPSFSPRSISQARYDLYRHAGDTQFPIHPPEKYPQRPYLGALMNIVWPPFSGCPIWPFPPDPSCNRWFPPFISDDTPRTGLLVSACFDLGGTRRTGRRNREEDGESEKASEREKERRKRDGKEGRIPAPTDVDSTAANGGAGPDSKLEKICSESLD